MLEARTCKENELLQLRRSKNGYILYCTIINHGIFQELSLWSRCLSAMYKYNKIKFYFIGNIRLSC